MHTNRIRLFQDIHINIIKHKHNQTFAILRLQLSESTRHTDNVTFYNNYLQLQTLYNFCPQKLR